MSDGDSFWVVASAATNNGCTARADSPIGTEVSMTVVTRPGSSRRMTPMREPVLGKRGTARISWGRIRGSAWAAFPIFKALMSLLSGVRASCVSSTPVRNYAAGVTCPGAGPGYR